MPWKECHVMDERLRFVARLLEGERGWRPYAPANIRASFMDSALE